MAVVAGSVFGETYKTVYNLIKDNTTTASGTFPNVPQEQVIQYPLYTIIVGNTNPDFKSFGRVNKGKELNVLINCFSKSARQVDKLVDEAVNVLENNQEVTSKSGLAVPEINVSEFAQPEINDEVVHSKTINANYKYAGAIG